MKPPKPGFTGTIRDSLGRKVRFVRGKRVRYGPAAQSKGTALGGILARLTGQKKGGSINQVVARIRNEPKLKARVAKLKEKVKAAVALVKGKEGGVDDLKIDGFVAGLKKKLGTVGYAHLLHKLGHADEHGLMVSLSNAGAKGSKAGKRLDKKKAAAKKKADAERERVRKKNAADQQKAHAKKLSRREAYNQVVQDVASHYGKLTPQSAAKYVADLEAHLGTKKFEYMLRAGKTTRRHLERSLWRRPEVALNVGRTAKRVGILARTGGLKADVAERLVGIFQKKFGAKGMHELYKRLKIGTQGQAARAHLVKMLTGDGKRRKVRTDVQTGDIFDDLIHAKKDSAGRVDMLGLGD